MRRPPAPEHRVTVERHPGVPGALAVTLRVADAQLGAGLLGAPIAAERLLGITLGEEALRQAPPEAAGLAGRVRLRVTRPDAVDLVAHAATLRRLGALVEVAPAALGDGGLVMLLASLGVAVALDPAAPPAPVLATLTRYFLHSPTLEIPIEPFYLAAAALGADDRRRATLADHYRARPGRDLYVTAEGRVSLSAALAAEGRFVGALGDGLAAWREAPLWRQTAAFAERVFAEAHPCACCPHWAFCRGLYRLPDPATDACAGWRVAFDEIRRCFHATRAAAGRG